MFRQWLMTSVRAPDGGAGSSPPAAAGSAGTAAASHGAAAGAAPGADAGGAAGGGGASAAAPQPAKAFADTLPQDLRELAMFKDIKDLDGLARGFANAQKMVGLDKARLVALPAEGDAAAEAEFYAKIGRPEAPDKYGFKAPEGVTVDAKLQEAFAAKAHEAGLTTKQANALYEWWNGAAGQARAAADAQAAQATQTATAALKTEWGAAFDQNLALAKGALAHYGTPDVVRELDAGLGNNPGLIKLFAKLGAGLKEDGLIGKAGAGGGDTIQSPTEARQQIASLKGDKTFIAAYTSKAHPGHAAAVEKMRLLHEQAYPTAA